MTREERAAQRTQRLRERLDATKRAVAQAEAQQRAAERSARNKRRFHVGTLADEAGLLSWDDVTLAGLFQIIAPLRDLSDPVGVLAGLLEPPGPDALSVPFLNGAIGTSLRDVHPGTDGSTESTSAASPL
jgi:hypothetical protein